MKFKLKFLIFISLEILLLGTFSFFLFLKEMNFIHQEIQTRLQTVLKSILFISKKENQLNTLDIDFMDKLVNDLSVENLYKIRVEDELKFEIFGSKIEKNLEKNFEETKKEYLNLEKNHTFSQKKFFEREFQGKSYFSLLQFDRDDKGEFFIGVDLDSSEYKRKIQLLGLIYGILFLFVSLIFSIFTYLLLKKGLFYFYSKLFIFEVIFLFLLSLMTYYFLYRYYESKIYEKFDSKLYVAAKTLNYVLPLNYHDKLDEVTQDKFLELKELLSRFSNFMEVHYAYTIIYENGKFLYSSTNETEEDIKNNTVTNFLDEAESNLLYLAEEAYLENKIIILNDKGTKWGDFRSILIPRRNIQKRDYIIAIDILLKDVQQEIKNIFWILFFEEILIFCVYFLLYKLFLFPVSSYFWKLYTNRSRGLSVKYKLAILMSFLFTLGVGVISGIFFYNSKKTLRDITLKEVKLLSENISNIIKEDLLTDTTYEATNSFLMNLSKTEGLGLLDLYVINLYGKYVIDTGRSRLGEYASSSEIAYIQSIQTLDAKEGYSVKFKKEILKVTFPIFIEYENQKLKIGAAVFEYDKDLIYKPVYKMQTIVLMSGIVLLILVLITTIFLSQYLMNPIVHLTKGVQIISSGNLNYKIEVTTKDEIGILSEKFNEMTYNLKKSYDELEDKVRERTTDLQKSQKTLLTVLSNSPLALLSIDKNGIINLAEGKNLYSIGVTSETLLGISIFELFASYPDVTNNIRMTLDERKQTILQIELGGLFFEVNSSPFSNTEEELIGAVVLLFDITENVKAKELIQKEKEKSDSLLLNILPEPVARELKENGFVKPTLFESVTVLFTDFKGFTKIATKLSPTELLEKLDLIFLQFDQICERRGIEKLKTIGDAYMCVGGLPVSNLSHPVDTCLAAIEMQNFMKETKLIMESISGEEFWDMRLGIHTGTVVAGVIGKTKFAYDVWGDAVNTASRMESNGEIGMINISSATYERVKDFFVCEYRGKIEAKNKGVIDMYFLLRLKPELSKDANGIVPNEKFFELYKEKFESKPEIQTLRGISNPI